jgi:amidophosphoribosyltransferase
MRKLPKPLPFTSGALPFAAGRPHEECGIFGIFGHPDAAAHTALGLHALQHRGQEAAGIVTYDGRQFYSHRALGLVGDNFSEESVIAGLPGATAIGHNRYSTTGETVLRNVQPLFAHFESGGFAIAHNGNLTNALALRKRLVKRGCLFQSTMDTEVIVHLIATSSEKTVVERLIDALHQVSGAYSLVAMTDHAVLGVRDPLGIRPLVLGVTDGATILTSESCALDILGADKLRDVEPGEVVVLDRNGTHSIKPFLARSPRFCIFEYIYFSRPDSVVEGRSVYAARKRIGAELARESPVDADVVIPVPDSGVPAAMGYAEEAGLPFEVGIVRNHYVGRTFIEPTDRIRHLGVKLKHNANREAVEGKRVILIDDSIVRGTTSEKIVSMMREAGAREVHMRISSPPTTRSCFYGIDTPEENELIAANQSVAGIARITGVDSLAYLSIDGLYRAMGETRRNAELPQFCDACFTGDYAVPLIDREEGEMPAQLSLLAETD